MSVPVPVTTPPAKTQATPPEVKTVATTTPAGESTAVDKVVETAKTAESTEVVPEPSAADRAKIAADRARKGSSFKKAALQKASIAEYKATLANQQAQRVQQQLAETQQMLEAYKRDPYTALRKAGLSDKDIAARSVQEGSLEHVVQSLQEQLAEESKKRKLLEDSINSEKFAVKEREAEANFVKMAKTEATYPHLSKQPEKVIIALANHVYADLARKINPATGRPANENVSWKDVCDYLEYEYVQAQPKVVEEPKVEEATTEASEAVKEIIESSSSSSKDKSKPKSKTLTQKSGTSRYSLPANFDKLSDAAQKKAMAEAMRTSGFAK